MVQAGGHSFIQLQKSNNIRIRTGKTTFFSETPSSHRDILTVLHVKIL